MGEGYARLQSEVLELLPEDVYLLYAECFELLSGALHHSGRSADIVLFVGLHALFGDPIGHVARLDGWNIRMFECWIRELGFT